MAELPHVADQLLVAVRRIVRRISLHSQQLSRESGLTVPQWITLRGIQELNAEHDEVTLAMVARRVQLSSATVSRIVDRLTRAGLTIRERGSQDRRRLCLTLSDHGHARLEALSPPLQEGFVARFMQLPADEREHLIAALDRIAELMEADDIDAAPILAPGPDIRQES